MIYKRPDGSEPGKSTPAEKTGKKAGSPGKIEEPRADYGTKQEKKKKKGGSKWYITVLIIVGIVAAAVGGTAIYVSSDMNGNRPGSDETETFAVTVEQGSTTEDISKLLKENGVVRSWRCFKYYSIFKDYQDKYNYGEHEFTKGMTYDEIAEELMQTTPETTPTVTEMFAEGKTALAMALQLEEDGFCTVDEFIDAANNDTYDVSFYDQIPDDENRFIKLEGYLFPDTYEFPVGSTAHEIIQIMLENFEKKVLTDEVKTMVENSGLTLDEVLVMASIVEKETLTEENDQNIYCMVASVFMNRLNNPDEFPCLESDASTEHLPGNFIYGVLGYYYNGDIEPTVRNIPQGMIDGYDTYTHEGIIIGAICNPGYMAIYGVLNPAETDYYFVLTDDANNYYWATTVEEHEQNIADAAVVNEEVANGTYQG